jgi:GMP synthase (glutamine-hydrolysing)
MRGKIALIVHQKLSTPGRIGRELRRMGYATDVRRVCLGDPLPEFDGEHVGAVIFGGPMNVHDEEEFPFLRLEKRWIAGALDSRLPFLGVCLGGQMLAEVLGAPVEPHSGGLHEIGYHPIRGTSAGEWLFDSELVVYQWHSYGFGLPAGAVRLATSEAFKNQAFRYEDSAYAIQFHPEVTAKTVDRWTDGGAAKLGWRGAQSKAEQLRLTPLYQPRIRAWLRGFLPHWLDAPTL